MLVLELLAPDDYEIPRTYYCFGRITRPLWVSPRHKTRHKNACMLLRSSDNDKVVTVETNWPTFGRLTKIFLEYCNLCKVVKAPVNKGETKTPAPPLNFDCWLFHCPATNNWSFTQRIRSERSLPTIWLLHGLVAGDCWDVRRGLLHDSLVELRQVFVLSIPSRKSAFCKTCRPGRLALRFQLLQE